MGQNKGMVKFYKADKGFGFLDTDRGSVFFHISEVNEGVPEPGMIVSCDIISTPKGLQAKNIQLMAPKTSGKFIRIGNERIKISNIKNYHIINEISAIERAKNDLDWAERNISNPIDWAGRPMDRSKLLNDLQRAQQNLQKIYNSNDSEFYKNPKILQIITYQNDYYWFTDIKNRSNAYDYLDYDYGGDNLVFGVDVDAIVQELDKLLT